MNLKRIILHYQNTKKYKKQNGAAPALLLLTDLS